MANPRPIRSLRKQENDYGLLLKKEVLDPLFLDLRKGLAEVVALDKAYQVIEDVTHRAIGRDLPVEEIEKHFAKVNTYHRARLFKSFKAALGVDITPLLHEETVRVALIERVERNVDLIKTIPPRFHESLKARFIREFKEAPFDEARVSRLLMKEYGSTGYNLRRLSRDQTQKTVNGLTEIRHKQLGLQGYIWRTSEDERVRPTHNANNGTHFRWDDPPVVTGHPGEDIQCRCTPEPAIRKEDRKRLKNVPRQQPVATSTSPTPPQFPSASRKRTGAEVRSELENVATSGRIQMLRNTGRRTGGKWADDVDAPKWSFPPKETNPYFEDYLYQNEARDFQRMVAPEILERIKSPTVQFYDDVRSVASYWGNTVDLNKTYRPGVTMHELSHLLEADPATFRKAARFLSKRTRGNPTELLRDITKNPGYRVDEIAKAGGFKHPYTGKIYRDDPNWKNPKVNTGFVNDESIYMTEVITMGMEEMWKNPARFAREDPEFFDFIWETIIQP